MAVKARENKIASTWPLQGAARSLGEPIVKKKEMKAALK
jgi:hypothetical protein